MARWPLVGTGYWERVLGSGLGVPADRPLPELTAELTAMLGDPDPQIRDGLAYPTLVTWIERGVYDDLLVGFGDGMAAGLLTGLGEQATDSVFRRSFSALLLGECISRDNHRSLLPRDRVLIWGDKLAGWFLRERDLRGFVEGRGWAHAVAHGADALRALADSRHLGAPELTVLLDVVADRLLLPGPALVAGEPDRLAAAMMSVMRRGVVPLSVVEPWIARIAGAAGAMSSATGDPYLVSSNPQAFLRALHLQMSLSSPAPPDRMDLLLVLVDALRSTNPHFLARRPIG